MARSVRTEFPRPFSLASRGILLTAEPGSAAFGVGVYEVSGAIYNTPDFYATKLFLRSAYVPILATLFGWSNVFGVIMYESAAAVVAAIALYT